MKTPQVAIRDNNDPMKSGVVVHEVEKLDAQANFCATLISVMCAYETTNKNVKKYMKPDELVNRASDITKLAFMTFEREGWIIKVPTLEEIESAPQKSGKAGF